MRHAGRVAAEVLAETVAAVGVGVTTDELDAVSTTPTWSGAYPSIPSGYHGFPSRSARR